MIRAIENWLHRSIILFYGIERAIFEERREFQNIRMICTAKTINALCIITNGHHISCRTGKSFHDAMLQTIGVLIFINHNELMILLQLRSDMWFAFQKHQKINKQIIIIHQMMLPFIIHILNEQLRDFIDFLNELRVLFMDDIIDCLAHIDR